MSTQVRRSLSTAVIRRSRHLVLLIVPIALLIWVGLNASPAGASPPMVTVALAGSTAGAVTTGDSITYSVVIGNTGSTASGPVTITDDFDGFDPSSATCGSVPNCRVQLHHIGVACSVPPTLCVGGDEVVGVSWTIDSVAAESSGLTVSVNAFVDNNGGPVGSWTDQAWWTGDGCVTSGGCPTNTVSNPVATVKVTESASPPPRSEPFHPGGGTTLGNGQEVNATLSVANVGDAPSGTITVVDSIPPTTGTQYVPGSATCGTVPGCTLTVTPCTTTCPPLQSPCGPGTCGFVLPVTCGCAGATVPGTLLTWTISSVASGASGLNLFFDVTVNGVTSDVAVNAAMWNGHLSSPAPLLGPILTTGDGCVSSLAISPYPDFFGCPVTPWPGEVMYDLAQSTGPTTSTTKSPLTTSPSGSAPSITAGPVTAASGSLAFTGPNRATEWMAIVGTMLVVLGLVIFALADLPRRLMYRLAHLKSRRSESSLAVRSKAIGDGLIGGATYVAKWLLDR